MACKIGIIFSASVIILLKIKSCMELFVFSANSKCFTNWEIYYGRSIAVHSVCICAEGDS